MHFVHVLANLLMSDDYNDKDHQQLINQAQGKLTYYITDKSRTEAKIFLYYFKEGQLYYQSDNDYLYFNRIYQGTIRYLFSISTLLAPSNFEIILVMIGS